MKPYLAAAAIAVLATAAHAQPSNTAQQDCFDAASKPAAAHAQDGIAACTLALDRNPTQKMRAGTLVNRGIIEAAARQDEAAIADFTAALACDASLTSAWMGRGLEMLRTARYDEASADFTRVIELGAPDLHIAYFNRAEAQEAAGNVTAAYHDYRQGAGLAPDFAPAAQELSRFTVVRHQSGQVG